MKRLMASDQWYSWSPFFGHAGWRLDCQKMLFKNGTIFHWWWWWWMSKLDNMNLVAIIWDDEKHSVLDVGGIMDQSTGRESIKLLPQVLRQNWILTLEGWHPKSTFPNFTHPHIYTKLKLHKTLIYTDPRFWGKSVYSSTEGWHPNIRWKFWSSI